MGEQPKTTLVFGARNLGRGVLDGLLGEGWRVAPAARSDATLEAVRKLGALALRADVTAAASVEAALGEVAEARLRLVYGGQIGAYNWQQSRVCFFASVTRQIR